MSNEALRLIADERARQVEVEGWKPEHDDGHGDGELARAAACYAIPTQLRDGWTNLVSNLWPWNWHGWKPTPDDRVRELVKAGALIVAEIERLQREGGSASLRSAVAQLADQLDALADSAFAPRDARAAQGLDSTEGDRVAVASNGVGRPLA